MTLEGQQNVADRIKGIVFDGHEQITISPRGIAYIASELAKYSFLDATIDVEGTVYETIVLNTLKQEAEQFFTLRNVIQCMVEIMDLDQPTRVLDPKKQQDFRIDPSFVFL